MKAIIIRGPLGVGKTSVARRLAEETGGVYISVDQELDDHNLSSTDGIPLENFLKANEFIVEKATSTQNGIVIDGNFYYEEQLKNLIDDLGGYVSVFTLKAPVEVCLERDAVREKPYGEESTRFVHMMVSKFDFGTVINTENQTVDEVVQTVLDALARF